MPEDKDMPEDAERPRPHGDPLSNALHSNPEENRAQNQSDATPEEFPRDAAQDFRELSDRARGRGSSANGVPEFDEDDGSLRKKQYDEGAGLVSGID